ncbi:MFS transporter, partial [Endozoicomonas arenosclerae]|uniref:MFS transporter n=1 Tax=Endozoicomonas arenosclerae TaxID=1633495 RepID=UPI000A970708
MKARVSRSLTPTQLTGMLSGNVIEYFDYIVYGLMTPVLSTLFFPADNRLVSLIQTFAVFATSMLIRPVSALIIGWIGDRTNRRTALLLCSFTTGLGTFGIGCLPDVQTAGILAPLLLVLMRLLQGFGMAGEFCSVLVVTGELSPPAHRGI